MKVGEAVLKRRSVRSYTDEELSREKWEKVMDIVRMAPSAKNKQDWKFVIVESKRKKEKIYKAAHEQIFIKEAPVIIVGITTDPGYVMSCGIPSGIVDVTIAMDHLTLKAAEEGLGTCWIGAFEQEKVKQILDIPEHCEVVALMPMGYPKEPLQKKEKNRKDLEDIISYDTYE